MKRALLYRRGGLGDTILTFPILEILKRRGFYTLAVGNTDYFKLAKEVGWADEVLSEIPDGSFDFRAVISLDGNVYPFPRNREWIVSYYLRNLKLEENFSLELPLQVDPVYEGAVILHPSSGSKKKNPDPKLFLELERFLKGRGHPVIYIAGEADGWLKGLIPETVEISDVIELAGILKGAKLYVGLDSGVSHLSAYLGVRTVIIYGPSDPVVWRPVGRRIFQVGLNLDCSPCFPDTCEERLCLDVSELFKKLVPLIDHLLVDVD